MKYHYVYRITNKELHKHYYGVRTSTLSPKDDLGVKYFSSSCDKEFIKEQKEFRNRFRYKIIFVFPTREECINIEIKLHSKFNVSSNPNFYNKAKQLSTGFDCAGVSLAKAHKEKIGLKHAGKVLSKETRKLISINHADVSGELNPMYGKPSAMRGKVSVVNLETGVRQVLSSEEYRQNKFKYQLTSQLKPKSLKTVVCPYCGKEGRGANMGRYHFNKCKEYYDT